MEKCFGFNVRIRFVDGKEETLHNVTEIHYAFPSLVEHILGKEVAFESSIHSTGVTYPISKIAEFEAICAKKIEEVF